MKLAIISDTHFGFAWGGARQEDSFVQAKEAFDRVIDLGVDAILMPGDLFDSRVPSQEVLEKAMRVLSYSKARHSGVTVDGKEVPGTPIIAIHGTHERRGSNLKNPLHVLEAAGIVFYLHCSNITIEKDGEAVSVFGLSGVPESYAPDVLKEWSPKPNNNQSIFMLHQSFKECVYEDAAFLTMDNLPQGFDLYINGHIHLNRMVESGDNKMLLPGSTITTQLRKEESKNPKGFYVYDTVSKENVFHELKTSRQLTYLSFEFNSADQSTVVSELTKAASQIDKTVKPKPLVKVKLRGSLKPGHSINKSELESIFSPVIVSIDNGLAADGFKKRIQALREKQAAMLSVEQMGMVLLKESLKQADYKGTDPETLFPVLETGDVEKAIKTMHSKQPSL